MRSPLSPVRWIVSTIFLALVCHAEVSVVFDRNGSDSASPAFKFPRVPSPAKNDAASRAKFTLVEGNRDANGGELETLSDGRMPAEEDQPGANFFFRAGTDGGRVML